MSLFIVYNESFGWAYGNIDFIVFPMGLYVSDGIIYLSIGRNDREGWIISLNQTKYLASLEPFESAIMQDYDSMEAFKKSPQSVGGLNNSHINENISSSKRERGRKLRHRHSRL